MTPEHRLNLIITILSRGAERLAADSQRKTLHGNGSTPHISIEGKESDPSQRKESAVRGFAP